MNRNWKLMKVLCIVVLAAMIGCAEEPAVETTTVDVDTTDTSVAEDVDVRPSAEHTVDVVLTSFDIEMPETLPAGSVLFVVSNESDMEHNFEIEGQGIEKELEENLQGQEVKMLKVDLVPGEYRVYCPIGDHASQGMDMNVTVVEGEATDTSGESEEIEGEYGDEESPPADGE
ncbi:MAG: hypothetical protein R3338_00875 [Thermoanaerobaculia bacterium]|nr:hypothetical protein [Thermoanaerobaculia bacterium]